MCLGRQVDRRNRRWCNRGPATGSAWPPCRPSPPRQSDRGVVTLPSRYQGTRSAQAVRHTGGLDGCSFSRHRSDHARGYQVVQRHRRAGGTARSRSTPGHRSGAGIRGRCISSVCSASERCSSAPSCWSGRGERRHEALKLAVLIHASDMLAAAMAAWSQRLPPGVGRTITAISAVNTVLAIYANAGSRAQRAGRERLSA